MSEQQVTSGTDVNATSGAGKNDLVDKIKKEKENWIKANSEKEKTIQELQNKLEEVTKAEMLKQQQYKELAELEAKKRIEAETKAKSLEQTLEQGHVNTKLRNELLGNGLRPDLIDEALRLIDRSNVVLHPETRTVLGADDAAKSFKEKYKDIFFGHKVPGVSYNAAGVTPKTDKSLGEMSIKDKLETLKKLKF